MACICGRHIRDFWVGGEEGGELTDPPETGDTFSWGLSQRRRMRQVNRHSPVSSTASDGRH